MIACSLDRLAQRRNPSIVHLHQEPLMAVVIALLAYNDVVIQIPSIAVKATNKTSFGAQQTHPLRSVEQPYGFQS